MSSIPIISVIIPVYNAEKTIRECVDSILSQNYSNFELILVDDGSIDESANICDNYAEKDNRIRVFHKQNGGVSSARNLGLEKARGEWIAFVDADDYITDSYLDGVSVRKEDIIIKGYNLTSSNEIVCLKGGGNDFSNFLNKYIDRSLFRGPVYKFYRKSIIADLRFIPEMKIGEDSYFVFMYLAHCRSLAVLPKGDYIVREAGVSDEEKYAISVDYAVQSLKHLKDAFDVLVHVHDVNKGKFLSYVGYFKRISKFDWQNDKSKWYKNKGVKTMYNYVWPSLSFYQKCRLFLCFTFSCF